MVSKVEMWKAHDGKVFQSEQEALSHEMRMKVESNLHNLADSLYMRCGDTEEVVEFLQENAKELVNYLSYWTN